MPKRWGCRGIPGVIFSSTHSPGGGITCNLCWRNSLICCSVYWGMPGAGFEPAASDWTWLTKPARSPDSVTPALVDLDRSFIQSE